MATNPMISQGTLNRLRGSITIPNFPQLNVTAPYLGRPGVKIGFEGDITKYLPQMTGSVTSQEPYVQAEVTAVLLKTQGLSDLYKTQMELSSLLGDITVRPDVGPGGVTLWQFSNCSIMRVDELTFNGEDAGFPIHISGYWSVNAALWNI